MDVQSEYARPFFFEEGERAVLLIHGFTGTPAHMRPLGDRLHAMGYAVQGILLLGHGTSIADMRRATWQKWLDAALTQARLLRERYGSVAVAGLSMGGCLALICAEQMEVAGCVTLSAPMKTQNKFTALARPLSLFVPELKWGGKGAVYNDALMRDYNIGYGGFPTAKVYDLNCLMHLARRNLYSVTCPLLAVQSRDDETISGDSADIILNNAGSAVKEALWLEKVPHVCTISRECDAIAQRMDDFLRKNCFKTA